MANAAKFVSFRDLVIAVIGLGAGFLIAGARQPDQNHARRRDERSTHEPDAPPDDTTAAATPGHDAERRRARADAGVVNDGGVASLPNPDDTYAVEHSLDRIGDTLHLAEQMGGLEGGDEAIANTQQQYIQGWMDAVTELQPSVLPQMGQHISDTMCSGNPSNVEVISYARMLLHAGERMGTMRDGLRCFLRRHHEEDVALWTVLEAWRRAHLGTSPEWEAWRDRATDERTSSRLADYDESGRGRPERE